MNKKLLLCGMFIVMSLILVGCFSVDNVSIMTKDYDSVIGNDYKGTKKTLLVKMMSSVKDEKLIGASLDNWNRPVCGIYLNKSKVEIFTRELYKALKTANYNIVMMQDYENCSSGNIPKIGGYLKIDLIKFEVFSKQGWIDYPITTDIQFNATLFSFEARKKLWEKLFVKQDVLKPNCAQKKQYEEAISKCVELSMIEFVKEIGSKEFRNQVVGFPEDSSFEEYGLAKSYNEQISAEKQEYIEIENKKVELRRKKEQKELEEKENLLKSKRGSK